jgi:putative ABC transport system permease protein
MAFQNLLQRPTRTFMLILAVAIATSVVFSSLTLARGIEASICQGFDRMGADLLVVPDGAMVNITSALLTVQPTDQTIEPDLAAQVGQIDGVERIASQTIHRVSMMAGMPCSQVNLIAFDPTKDFTVTPWLSEHLSRPIQKGDLICGYRRSEAAGNEVQLAGVPMNIYGKLGRSGVGPFDESYFATYETVASLNPKMRQSRPSALLVRLSSDVTPESVRFAISKLPGLKVITAQGIVTATRRSTEVLLAGMVAIVVSMLFCSLILLGLLFSAIIAERRREIGLLMAIGSRRSDVVRMLVSESGFATGIGGICGILLGICLLLAFQHSLVYYLETLDVQFAWPGAGEICAIGLTCSVIAVFVGLLGSVLPAWLASREEAQSLIKSGGS